METFTQSPRGLMCDEIKIMLINKDARKRLDVCVKERKDRLIKDIFLI